MGKFKSLQLDIEQEYLETAEKLFKSNKNDLLLNSYLSLIVHNYKDQIDIAKKWDTYLDAMKELLVEQEIVDKEHAKLLSKYYISDLKLDMEILSNKVLLKHYFLTKDLDRYIKMLSVKEEFIIRLRTNTIEDYDKDLQKEYNDNQILIEYEINDSKMINERTVENFKKRISLLNDLIQANINIGFTRKLNFEKYYTKITYEQDVSKINELVEKIDIILKEIQYKLNLQNELIVTIQKHMDELENKYYSLEECASYYSVSRERIRQIESKAVSKLYYKFKDDNREKKLQYIYNFTFDVTMEELKKYCLLHPVIYLINKDKDKTVSVQQFFIDFELTNTKLFEEYLMDNNLVFFENEYLKRNQSTIFGYYVNKYLIRPCSVDYVENDYTNFLKQNDLEEFASFDKRTIEGLLDRNNDVVKSHSLYHKVVTEYKQEIIKDFEKLLKKLPPVFSTKLIYERKKKLYQKAEIKDYYELHNFLKKNYENENVSYKRVPHIFLDGMTIEKYIVENDGKITLDEISEQTGIVLQTLINIKSSLNPG